MLGAAPCTPYITAYNTPNTIQTRWNCQVQSLGLSPLIWVLSIGILLITLLITTRVWGLRLRIVEQQGRCRATVEEGGSCPSGFSCRV